MCSGPPASAGDALAALAARRFDVVVSDLAVPQQSGFWLISKIDGHLMKPIGADAILAALAA